MIQVKRVEVRVGPVSQAALRQVKGQKRLATGLGYELGALQDHVEDKDNVDDQVGDHPCSGGFLDEAHLARAGGLAQSLGSELAPHPGIGIMIGVDERAKGGSGVRGESETSNGVKIAVKPRQMNVRVSHSGTCSPKR